MEEAKRRSEQEAREAEEKEKARQVGDQKAIKFKTVETKLKLLFSKGSGSRADPSP